MNLAKALGTVPMAARQGAVVYADDTLIVAGEPAKAELYMKAVEAAGAN